MKQMKQVLAGILCAALLLLPFGAVSSAKEAQVSFVVLGDSIAAGSGVQDKKDAYAWLIAGEKGYALQNFAKGGDTSADLLRKVTQEAEIRKAIRGADIIAVSIGGNDLMHADDVFRMVVGGMLGDYAMIEPVLAAFRANFAAAVAEIRAPNPKAMLIVQTLYNPAIPLPSLREAYGAAIGGLNESIRDDLKGRPGAFLLADVHAAFEGRYGAVYVDMTHPSADGHAVIAAVLTGVIDGAQAQLPPASGILALLANGFAPALWLLDKVLVNGLLRGVWTLAGLFV